MNRRREVLFVAGVCLLAFALRFAFLWFARNAPLTYDEIQYDSIAKHLVEGKGYAWYMNITTTFRPPLYPWIVAGIYYVFGAGNIFAVRLFQTLLGAMLPALVYFMGRAMFSAKTGKVAAVITALYGPFIAYSIALLIENLFPPLVAIFFIFLFKWDKDRRMRWLALSAFFLGLSILARPSLSGFVPLLFLWFLFPKKQVVPAVKSFAVLAAILTVMIAPWVIRNWIVADQFVYLDTRTGFNMYIGFNDNADGAFNFESAEELNRIYDDTKRHNYGMTEAKKWIRENPGRAIALIPMKFFHFWDLDKREFMAAYSANYIGYLPPPLLFGLFFVLLSPFALVTLFAVLGIAFSGFTRPVTAVLLLCGFYVTISSIILGDSRLHMALVPFLIVFASHGILSIRMIAKRARSHDPPTRKKTRKRLVVAACIMALFIGMWSYSIYRDMPKWRILFSDRGHVSYLPY